MISSAAQVVIATETDIQLSSKPREIQQQISDLFGTPQNLLRVFSKEQWMAPVASGSGCADAMVVCPCSSATLSAIAQGTSSDLMERAADVCIKEKRPLILVTREMPLSIIHLENMLRLARVGAVIMPASPGLYHKPTQISELIDFVVARVLDHLRVGHQLVPRWGEPD